MSRLESIIAVSSTDTSGISVVNRPNVWFAAEFREIWTQTLMGDLERSTVLVPFVGHVRRSAQTEPLHSSLRSSSNQNTDGTGVAVVDEVMQEALWLATDAAASWICQLQHPSDRALHLLHHMCSAVAALQTAGSNASGNTVEKACGEILMQAAAWFADLASVHYELPLPAPCSANATDTFIADAWPDPAADDVIVQPTSLVGLFKELQTCTEAAAMRQHEKVAVAPVVQPAGSAPAYAIPFYRQWQLVDRTWNLQWDGSRRPLDDPRTSPLPVPPLYPTDSDRKQLADNGYMMVPNDTVVFIYTYHGRHKNMKTLLSTWGRMVPHVEIFSDVADSSVPTHAVRPFRVDWADAQHGDVGHGSAFAPGVLEYLYQKYRGKDIRFFINFDDDVLPLWPAVLGHLRSYQEAHDGHYPYLVASALFDFVNPLKTLYGETDTSGSEQHKAKLVLPPSGGMAPGGLYYGFTIGALHDMQRVIDTCPIWAPGDNEQGALFHCMGRDPVRFQQDGWWLRNSEPAAYYAPPPTWMVERSRTLDEIYHAPFADHHDASNHVVMLFHHLKDSSLLERMFELYYVDHWGVPKG